MLTKTDLVRLTFYKWRHRFGAMGFDERTASCLVFLKFWASRRMLGGPMDGAL